MVRKVRHNQLMQRARDVALRRGPGLLGLLLDPARERVNVDGRLEYTIPHRRLLLEHMVLDLEAKGLVPKVDTDHLPSMAEANRGIERESLAYVVKDVA